jgi:7-cyano-7-deazaguanine synthase in queuosine biosynthesis
MPANVTSHPTGRRLSGAVRIRESRLPHLTSGDAIFVELTAKYGHPVPSVLLDLFDLSQQVIREDRHVRRSARTQREGWKRDLSITIPVRDYELWSKEEVQNALKDVLEFTTSDNWNVQFEKMPAHEYIYNMAFDYPEIKTSNKTLLMSEGCDSLCGLHYHISKSNDYLQCIHAVSQEERAAQLSDHLIHLSEEDRKRISVFKLPIRQEEVKNFEESSRSRSFILLCLAVITAYQSQSDEIFIYENGIESFNLPLLHHAEAERYSRIMHPIVVSRMEKLTNLLIPRMIKFRMPFLFFTKAEAIAQAISIDKEYPLTPEWIAQAISCHHFSARTNLLQCGICTGCILRRLSLRSIKTPDLSQYKNCIFTENNLNNQKDYKDIDRLYSGLSRLQRCLVNQDHWDCIVDLSGLDDDLPDELIQSASLLSGLSIQHTKQEICELYQRFLAEWDSGIEAITVLREVRNGA